MFYNGCFDFMLPTTVKFGRGRINEIGSIITAYKAKKVMIITDKGIINAGLVDPVRKSLEDEKIDIVIFDEVEPNPRDTTVQRAAEMAKKENVEALIAIGGGSSMDTAKGAGTILSNGGVINDYEGWQEIPNPILPFIAIPTTVGTGSEVTMWAVITDTKRKFKMSIGSEYLAPAVALVDPDMVANLPAKIIASTGMDALTHAIEGYTVNCAEPITDAAGLYAIEMIGKSIRSAVFTDCQESKSNMLLASLIAGICFGNSAVAGVHAMAEAIGGFYDTPHGVANAIFLPYVMEADYIADTNKHARIAAALGENIDGLSEQDAAYKAVEAVKRMNKDLGIPKLKDVGVLEKDLDILAQNSADNLGSPYNLRKLGKADYLDLFKKAFYE